MKKINLKFKKMCSSRSKMLGLVSAIVVLITLEVSLSSFLSVNTTITSHLHSVFKDKKLNISRKPSKSDNITTILKTRTKSKSSKVNFSASDYCIVSVYRSSKTVPVLQKKFYKGVQDFLYNLDVFEGDSIHFNSNFYFNVHGLSDISVMRFAGESIFVNSTISIDDHGKTKPFLHYDNIVHGVKMRPYPKQWKSEKYGGIGPYSYNKISSDGNGLFSFYWIAQGRRDVNYGKPSENNVKFSSFKKKSSGTYPNVNAFINIPSGLPFDYYELTHQRNNQKEGLNLEILTKFQKNKRFVAGLDPDELIYFNHGKSDVFSTDINNDAQFRYITHDFWKQYFKFEDDNDINETMVHILNSIKKIKNPYIDVHRYHIREIMDVGLYTYSSEKELIDFKIFDNNIAQPMFNNKRPVYYTNSLLNKPIYPSKPNVKIFPSNDPITGLNSIEFNINVLSPLEGKRKNVPYNQLSLVHRSNPEVNFYGIISGPIHVARNQQNVTYTVAGLPESENVPGKFQLVYTYEDNYGIIKEKKSQFLDRFHNTFTFDFEGGGYHDLTLRYFRNKETKTSVIIAGQELLDIDLRFISAPNEVQGADYSNNPTIIFNNQSTNDLTKYAKLDEAKGNGENWFIEDRINTYDVNNYGFHYGYDEHRSMKTYVLGEQQSISLTVNDADPHTFVHYNTDFYLSERRLSKRLRTNMMSDKSGKTLIEWQYDDNIGFTNKKLLNYGRHCNITPNIKNSRSGSYNNDFYVRAIYNNTSSVVVRIVRRKNIPGTLDALKSNANIPGAEDLGQVTAYPMNDVQFQLIDRVFYNNKLPNTKKDYVILKIENILSNYTYVDGPRYKTSSSGNSFSLIMELGEHKRFSPENNYLAKYNWIFDGFTNLPLPESSFNEYNNLPSKSWVRHLDGKPASKEIPYRFDHPRFEPFNGTEVFPFSSYNNNNTAGSAFVQFEPWQLRMPWIAQTGSHGYKTRWNIKCLYDVNKIFELAEIGKIRADNNSQIYRANVEGSNGSAIRPGLTDRMREELEFYYNLKSKRMVILTKDEYVKCLKGGNITVYTADMLFTREIKVFNANISNAIDPNNPDDSDRKFSSDTKDLTENAVQLAVYPNPSTNGVFNVSILSNEGTLEAMTLYNIVGKEIYSYPLQKINGQLEIKVGENLNLVSGVYLLRITIDGKTRTEKLIVN